MFLSAIGCGLLILLSGGQFHALAVCQKYNPHPIAPERVTALPRVPAEHSSACTSKRHREVFVAVTVKDRINYVKLFAENLEWLNISCVADVHVFDNGSKQFSASDLQNWFPYAVIHQLDTLQDADMATRRAFEYFISSSNLTTLVNMDSDSLLHPDWATFVSQVLPESDGALSLYHSAAPHHPSFNCNNITCEKKTTGALGMVFERKILEDALDNVAASKNALSNDHNTFIREEGTGRLQRMDPGRWMAWFKQATRYVGGTFSQCTTHSIRRSVVKWAARCGAQLAAIVEAGRWANFSCNFMTYWRDGQAKTAELEAVGTAQDPIWKIWGWEPTCIELSGQGRGAGPVEVRG